jgi:hypothetical protein
MVFSNQCRFVIAFWLLSISPKAASQSDLEILHVVELPPVVAPIPPDAVTPAIIKTQEELIEAAQKHMANLVRCLSRTSSQIAHPAALMIVKDERRCSVTY